MDSSGNTYVTGVSHDTNGVPVLRAQMYSVAGTVMWDKIYTAPGATASSGFSYFYSNAVLTSTRHLVIFATVTISGGTPPIQSYVLELDANGDKVTDYSGSGAANGFFPQAINSADDIYWPSSVVVGTPGVAPVHYRVCVNHWQATQAQNDSVTVTESDLNMGSYAYTAIQPSGFYVNKATSQIVLTGRIRYGSDPSSTLKKGFVCFMEGHTIVSYALYDTQFPNGVTFDSSGNPIVCYDGDINNTSTSQFGYKVFNRIGYVESQDLALPSSYIPTGTVANPMNLLGSQGMVATVDSSNNLYISYGMLLGNNTTLASSTQMEWYSGVARYTAFSNNGATVYTYTPAWTYAHDGGIHALNPGGNALQYMQNLVVNNLAGRVCILTDNGLNQNLQMHWSILDTTTGSSYNGTNGDGYSTATGYTWPSGAYQNLNYPVGLFGDPLGGFIFGGVIQHSTRYDLDFYTRRIPGP